MANEYSLTDLLVHEPPMRLLSELVSVDRDGACCTTIVSGNLPFIDEEGNLPGWVGIELMAQTIAVWGGWQAHNEQRDASVGLLLGARKYETSYETFPADTHLSISVNLVIRDGNMGVFQCTISDNARVVARAQVNAFMPNDTELQQVLERKI